MTLRLLSSFSPFSSSSSSFSSSFAPRALFAIAIACGAIMSPAIASADPGAVQQPAPGTRIKTRHAERDPADDIVGEALRDVKVRPEQRASIEQIKKEATAKRPALKAAKKTLLEAVAAQIEIGKIDRTALKSPINAVLAAWAEDSAAERAALDKLHALLDKTQRTDLADALESQLDKEKNAGWERGDVKDLAEDLKLTKEQRAELADWFKDQGKTERESHAQAKEREKKLLEAFKADKYQSEKAYPAASARLRPQQQVDRFIAVAAELVPVLTTEQRAMAATLLRDRASASAALRF